MHMVYKAKNWFIFEQGDKVMVLPSGKIGIVVSAGTNTIDIKNKNQVVAVQLDKGIIKEYDNNSLELFRKKPQ